MRRKAFPGKLTAAVVRCRRPGRQSEWRTSPMFFRSGAKGEQGKRGLNYLLPRAVLFVGLCWLAMVLLVYLLWAMLAFQLPKPHKRPAHGASSTPATGSTNLP